MHDMYKNPLVNRNAECCANCSHCLVNHQYQSSTHYCNFYGGVNPEKPERPDLYPEDRDLTTEEKEALEKVYDEKDKIWMEWSGCWEIKPNWVCPNFNLGSPKEFYGD